MFRSTTNIAFIFALISLILLGCTDDKNPASSIPDPVADFSWSGTTIAPASISFVNQSRNAERFLWDFDDGITSTEINPTHIFQNARSYTITLIASDNARLKSDTTNRILTVSYPDPIAIFSWSGNTVTPANISFNNLSQHADRFYWDFGDGRTSIQEEPSITFNQYGEFWIILIASFSVTSEADAAERLLTITPGAFYLEAVTVDEIPFTMPNGTAWDNNGTTPDLQWDFCNPSDNIILSTQTLTDVSPNDFPIRWTIQTPYNISSWNSVYSFKFYDDDSPFGYEFMGSVACRVNSLISSGGYVQSYSLNGANNTIRLRISVQWR